MDIVPAPKVAVEYLKRSAKPTRQICYPLTSKDWRFDQLNQFINLNEHRDCDFEVSADLRIKMSVCFKSDYTRKDLQNM